MYLKKLFLTLFAGVLALGSATAAPKILIEGLEESGDYKKIDNGTAPPALGSTTFGDVALGASAERKFRITNAGDEKLNITSSRVGGSQFVLVDFPGNGSAATINPGATVDFLVRFTVANPGEVIPFVRIFSDDPAAQPQFNYQLSGNGLEPPDITVSGLGSEDDFLTITDGATDTSRENGTAFGGSTTGVPSTNRFLVANTGESPLNVASIKSNSSAFTVQSSITTVEPGKPGAQGFDITFTPPAAGTFDATIRINSDDPDAENPYTFTVKGSATDGGDIVVEGIRSVFITNAWVELENGESPPNRQPTVFGNTKRGQVSRESFRLRNDGGSPLAVSSITSSNPAFSINSSAPYTVATTGDGGTQRFSIGYAPTRLGDETATITIQSNDPVDPTFTFDIIGTGVGSNMQIFGGSALTTEIADGDTTPNAGDFTDFGAPILTTAPAITRTFRIRNHEADSNERLNLSNPRIVPASAPFTISGVLGVGGIGSGSFRDFEITFDPSVEGTFNAEVQIGTDDRRPDRDPFNFAITGRAADKPDIFVDGFGSSFVEVEDGATTTSAVNATLFSDTEIGSNRTRSIRIRNVGTGKLTVSNITTSNPSEFTLAPSALPDILSFGESLLLDVTFAPTTTGKRSSTITITNNDPTTAESSYTFLVSGTGTVSTSSSPQIKVFSGVNFENDVENGSLTPIEDNFTRFPPTRTDTGIVTHAFQIRNPGSADLKIIGSSITGLHDTSFIISSLEDDAVIAPGGTKDFFINFDPTINGPLSAFCTIENSTSGDTEFYTFALAGTGTIPPAPPNISVFGGAGLNTPIPSGTSANAGGAATTFGDSLIGSRPRMLTYSIKNSSPGTVLTLSGGIELDAGPFSISSSPPSIIGTGQSAEFTILYTPTAAPSQLSSLVQITSDDPDTPTYTFSVVARTVAPASGGNPTIGNVSQDGDDLIFSLDPATGTTYRITTSTDLSTWTVLPGQTGIATSPIRLSNVIGQGGGPTRFYRLEEE